MILRTESALGFYASFPSFFIRFHHDISFVRYSSGVHVFFLKKIALSLQQQLLLKLNLIFSFLLFPPFLLVHSLERERPSAGRSASVHPFQAWAQRPGGLQAGPCLPSFSNPFSFSPARLHGGGTSAAPLPPSPLSLAWLTGGSAAASGVR
jgi:hypothetical protein